MLRFLKKSQNYFKRNVKIALIILFLIIILLLAMMVKDISRKSFLEVQRRIETRENILQKIEKYNEENIKNEKHRLPKVIGIGVKKCGTDGVISFLNHHPLVRILDGIESFFFSSRTRQNLDVYRNMMPLTNDRQVAMEKTPIYFAFPPINTPELIKTSIPDVKLILIVCDPTLRAFSDYVHERIRYDLYDDPMIRKYKTFEEYVDEYLPKLQRNIKEWQKISSKLSDLREKIVNLVHTDEASTLLSNGIYSAHIKQWQSVFNASNLRILDGNRFMQDPGSIIEELQDFIGIPKVLLKEDFVRHPHTGFFCYRQFTMKQFQNQLPMTENMTCLGGGKGRTRNGRQKADEETLKKLRAFYRPFTQQFFEDIGESFSWNKPTTHKKPISKETELFQLTK